MPSERLHGRIIAAWTVSPARSGSSPRPQGFPDEDLFEVAETSIPDPADGQVLIRNAYFSVDPYMRPRMNDVRSYVAPFTLGEAMTGGAVGRVAASRNPRYAEGDWVAAPARLARVGAVGRVGAAEARSVGRADLDRARRSRHAGLHSVVRAHSSSARRRRARPVFVSGAAGAVGSAAGQMARDRRVPRHRERGLGGEAGVASRARVRRGVRLPRAEPTRMRSRSSRRTESTSTSTTSAAITSRPRSARFERTGASSRAARSRATTTREPAPGPRNMFLVVTKRLRIQGYIISDHFDRFGEFAAQAAASGCATADCSIARRSSRGSRTPRRRSSAFSAARTSGRCSSRSARPSEAALPALRPSAATSPTTVLPHRALSALRALWQARPASQPLITSVPSDCEQLGHRLRGPHAVRAARRRSGVASGHRARLDRDPRRARAGRPRGGRGRVRDHGTGAAGWSGAGAGTAGGGRRRDPEGGPRRHDQQGVRVVDSRDRDRGSHDPRRRATTSS